MKTKPNKKVKIVLTDGCILSSPDGDSYKVKIINKNSFKLKSVKETWKVIKTYA